MSDEATEHAPPAELQTVVKRAEQSLATAQERARAALAIDKLVKAVSEAITIARPSAALRALQQSSKARDALRSERPGDSAVLDDLEASLLSTVAELFENLPYSFPDAARAAGLTLDPGSRHPRYTLADGFLEVRFDKAKAETRLQPRNGKRESLGIDLPDIIDKIGSELVRLFERSFEPATFFDTLVSAHKKSAAGKDSVPIAEIVLELRKAKGFRDDEFNVDLSRLVRSVFAGSERLTLEHTRDSKQGMQLWQMDARGYYGYLRVGGA